MIDTGACAPSRGRLLPETHAQSKAVIVATAKNQAVTLRSKDARVF